MKATIIDASKVPKDLEGLRRVLDNVTKEHVGRQPFPFWRTLFRERLGIAVGENDGEWTEDTSFVTAAGNGWTLDKQDIQKEDEGVKWILRAISADTIWSTRVQGNQVISGCSRPWEGLSESHTFWGIELPRAQEVLGRAAQS